MENVDANWESRMPSKISDKEHLAAKKKLQQELPRYLELFEAAFDELHDAVVKKVKTPGQYVGPHHDYPVMSMLDSGFPSFRDIGFYTDSAPRDYVGTMLPSGFLGLLGGYQRPKTRSKGSL